MVGTYESGRNGSPLDMLAILSDEQKPALTVSASSLARTIKATMPSKTRKYDTSQAVEELYREHAALSGKGRWGSMKRWPSRSTRSTGRGSSRLPGNTRSLSPIFGEEDLRQEALAILQALQKYRHSPDVQMKFSTYLEWSIRNISSGQSGTGTSTWRFTGAMVFSAGPWGTGNLSSRKRPWKSRVHVHDQEKVLLSACFWMTTWRQNWINRSCPV